MSNIELNTQMKTLKLGRKITSYTGVVINAGKGADGKDRVYSAGNQTGYVLELDNPYGSQAMANSILASVKARGVPYQPFKSDSTLIDPAAEIGDGVTVNGKQATIWSIKTRHSPLLAADVAAPMDEEINHEYRYTPRQTREFKRESAYTRSRLTINQDEIRAEVVRATGAESSISGSLSVQADRITAEVTRAQNAENRISASVTVQADRITSEVTRATTAESGLGTRIDQRLDNITLSVTSASGASTFTLKDGSTTLDTKTLDLSVKAVNISGKLTIGQLDSTAQGQLVVSSESKTQYYLSTSYNSATGGSWQDTIPTWESGKYYWTRQSTTVTYADNTTETKNSTAVYDKNMTRTESTAISRERMIYYSIAAGSPAPSAPTAWVTDVSGGYDKWTCVRPEYSQSFPALYTASQRTTVGGDFACSTPKLDTTTTVIDGANIITRSITADAISVANLQSISASIAGWELTSSVIRKTTDTSQAYLQSSSSATANAFCVRTRPNAAGSWTNQFYVRYNGLLYAKNAQIEGQITATSGTIGGVTIENGTLTGLNTDNFDNGTNTNLGYAAGYGANIGTDNYSLAPPYFKAGTLRAGTRLYTPAISIGSYGASWKYLTVKNSAGTEVSEWILTGSLA